MTKLFNLNVIIKPTSHLLNLFLINNQRIKFDLKYKAYCNRQEILVIKVMTRNNDNNVNQTLIQKAKQAKQIGDFIIGKVLGQGTFGKVRLGTHKLTKQKVAIKFLQKKKISQVADVQRVTRQIHILKLIRHPNLVQLYQIIQTPKQLLLIMQFMQNGQLFDHIVKSKRIVDEQAKKIFHQLIDGIQYMHRIGVAHRDLKPENILLSHKNQMKIVDFGLSNTYKTGQRLKTPCGSPCYAAPEMIQGEKYDGLKIDIWSCGIILFAMLNGYLPFEDQNTNALYKKVLTGDYTFYHSVSEQGKDLIQKILNNKPSQRFTIQEIRRHPWMQKYKGKKTHEGIIVGYNKIPVDQQILSQLPSFGKYDINYVRTCIEANRHNDATVTYYLSMKKHLNAGGVSKYDLGNDQFDKKSIQPVRRKDNTTSILIDNFLTKHSCGGSADITHNQKRKIRFSKDKQENKQNMSILMNRKKSKEKPQRKSKDKSKDNIKLVLKQQNHNVSNLFGSMNGGRTTSKLNQSVDRRSQSVIKKVKSGSSTSKIQRKGKSNKLECSMNYGKIPLARSIQKNSGRESEQHKESHYRQSILQNRVTRKYREQFDQSLISKSKGKMKTQTQRQRSRINSSINQSVNHCPNNHQAFNTTTITNVNTYSGHALMNLSKKYKQHDTSSAFIEQYLMKGKKLQQKKTDASGSTKLIKQSSKMIKPRKL